jgi:hypothetical protein
MINWLKTLLFRDQVEELKRIEKAMNEKLEIADMVYTTVRSFRGIDAEYYGWVCETLSRDEYRYMLFDLRENVFREMSDQDDKEKVMRSMGRLDMINVIDNYLKRYKRDYEDSIRRNIENAEK